MDKIEIPENSLQEDLKNMVNKKEYSDVTFLLDSGEVIFAHKIILTNRSQHFKSMFQVGMKEGELAEIKIPLISFNTFLSFLEYIYSSSVNLTGENVAELLIVSDRFTEEKLKLLCQQYIENNIDHQSVSDCFALANQVNATHLRKYCLNYILVNHEFIKNLPSYQSLPQSLLDEISSIIQQNQALRGNT